MEISRESTSNVQEFAPPVHPYAILLFSSIWLAGCPRDWDSDIPFAPIPIGPNPFSFPVNIRRSNPNDFSRQKIPHHHQFLFIGENRQSCSPGLWKTRILCFIPFNIFFMNMVEVAVRFSRVFLCIKWKSSIRLWLNWLDVWANLLGIPQHLPMIIWGEAKTLMKKLRSIATLITHSIINLFVVKIGRMEDKSKESCRQPP